METFFNDLAITTALGGPCSGIDSALDNEEVFLKDCYFIG
jgi:hypothetical protein